MTDARWRRAEELYHATLERAERERAAFLRDACAGDERLRSEVESLLACDGSAEGFLLQPPAAELVTRVGGDDSARFLTGQQIGTYHVLSLIGAGGMGEVYRARDTRLDRDVAIKILPHAFTAVPERLARFEREARVLAAFSHPNIATIYGIQESDGTPALVMEMVEGETLAERVARAPLPVAEALGIARQIAEALEAAHDKGIVHRDLKPANIKITPGGNVKVLDFGLAKAIDEGTAQPASPAVSATDAGRVVGTAAYMSPEQARGQSVDTRTDIWALGCVIYEMVTGRSAFARETVTDTLAAVVEKEPDWTALPAGTPEDLRQLVEQCLRKDARQRLRDAGGARIRLEELSTVVSKGERPWAGATMRILLRPLALAAVILLVATMAALMMWRGSPQYLVVLPFVNLSNDPDNEYFSEGLTDELINALSNVPGLRVSRAAMSQFKNRRGDIRELGRQLNVDAIVEGSIRYQDKRIRITVQLNNVAEGYYYWSRTWDREMGDLLAIQQDIAQQVARSLRPSAAGVENTRHPLTTDTEAYNLYLQAQFHRRRAELESFRKARALYQQAIDRDPRFAEAYVGLAMLLNVAATMGHIRPSEAIPQSKVVLSKALELNPSLASAYAAQGWRETHFDRDWAAAERNLNRAIEMDPSDPDARHTYSHLLIALGRFGESLAESQRAIDLDPVNAEMRAHLVVQLAFTREFESAIKAASATFEIDPNNFQGWLFAAFTYESTGQIEKAIDARSHMTREPPELIDAMRAAFRARGAEGYWQALIDNRLERSKSEKPDASQLAYAYARLGKRSEAMDWLEYAVQEREGWVINVNANHAFDGLRGDPRFDNLVARIGLPVRR